MHCLPLPSRRRGQEKWRPKAVVVCGSSIQKGKWSAVTLTLTWEMYYPRRMSANASSLVRKWSTATCAIRWIQWHSRRWCSFTATVTFGTFTRLCLCAMDWVAILTINLIIDLSGLHRCINIVLNFSYPSLVSWRMCRGKPFIRMLIMGQ